MNIDVRQQWRVIALVVLLLLSTWALFVPGGGGGTGEAVTVGNETAATDAGMTNLRYGLELSGGTRLRAPITGWTATGVDVPQSEVDATEQTVATELGLTRNDVNVRPGLDAIEVYADVDQAAVRAAVETAGRSPSSVERGVTEPTRNAVVETLKAKIDATGFSGATVQLSENQAQGIWYVVIEVPNRNETEVRSLVEGRGAVRIDAYYPENGSQVRTAVLTKDDLRQIGQPTTLRNGRPAVPVVLTDDAGERFQQDMRDYGFTTEEAASNCEYENKNDTDWCLLTVRDDEVVYSAGVTGGENSLQSGWESGEWAQNPQFVITSTTRDQALQLYVDLNAGALPAPLDLQRDTSYYLQPSLAERFKLNSLVTGIVAAAAVAGVIFLRYGRKEVAGPMFLTAMAEVYILLGFAAGVGFALDLSHIAGFIAVIGTGVDDLVIIADEVLTEDVRSNRVFKSRFRKALWIIGAAAATTIIAMSPLAILSLGDLRGFAIITILGVLIGVIVTRPAYGDILRSLITGDH
jgi:preprotein translocase subunit SecD